MEKETTDSVPPCKIHLNELKLQDERDLLTTVWNARCSTYAPTLLRDPNLLERVPCISISRLSLPF